jgi:hypothetical protein
VAGVVLSAESLKWFRATYKAEYDEIKFEKIAFWLQRQQVGRRFKTGENLPFLKYYHDLTKDTRGLVNISFSTDHKEIQITK